MLGRLNDDDDCVGREAAEGDCAGRFAEGCWNVEVVRAPPIGVPEARLPTAPVDGLAPAPAPVEGRAPPAGCADGRAPPPAPPEPQPRASREAAEALGAPLRLMRL